MNWLNMHW